MKKRISNIVQDDNYSAVELAHDYDIIIDKREIFLYGHVDENGDLATKFIKNLRVLENLSKDSHIIIHQYNTGGDWCSGMAIFDSIVACPCPILFVCHGIAASMGSVIPMACVKHPNSYRVNMPNCYWLIHDGQIGIDSTMTYKQHNSWHLWNTNIRETMLDLYSEAGLGREKYRGKTQQQIKNIIKKHLDNKEDWWLTAREAADCGLVDGVLGDEGFETIEEIIKSW